MPSKSKAIKAPEIGPDVGFDATEKLDKGKERTIRYRIHAPEEIGINRMVQFNKDSIRMAYGHELADLIKGHLKMKGLLNEMKLYDAVIENNNQLHRLGDINADRDPKLWACTLFINTKDEDLTRIPTDADRAMKIEHWNAAGIPYGFFIRSLRTFNVTLSALYKNTTPSSRLSGEAVARDPLLTPST